MPTNSAFGRHKASARRPSQAAKVESWRRLLRLVVLPLLLAGCLAAAGSERFADPALLAQCPTLTANAPTTAEEAATARRAGRTWSDAEVRRVYLCRVDAIAAADRALEAAGKTMRDRAYAAWDARHRARLTARAMMSDWQEVAELRARDQSKYGHPDGPLFDELVAKHRGNGKSHDEAYAAIIDSAQRTSVSANDSVRTARDE